MIRAEEGLTPQHLIEAQRVTESLLKVLAGENIASCLVALSTCVAHAAKACNVDQAGLFELIDTIQIHSNLKAGNMTSVAQSALSEMVVSVR